ncbi:MAG: hypothetical protein ACYC0V_00030 [Armatimonadota bacterium]
MKFKIAPWVVVVIIFGVLLSIGLAYRWYTEPDRNTATIEKSMADAEKIEESKKLLFVPGITPAMQKKFKLKHVRNEKEASSKHRQLPKSNSPDRPK